VQNNRLHWSHCGTRINGTRSNTKETIMNNANTETFIAWLDGQESNAVEFEAPVQSTFDIAQAAADALGVDVCDELNVKRK
jgi:hypothetical protein